MADRVELAFRRAARRLLPDAGSILVAVSGGADSIALLDLMARWAPRANRELTVAHLDHGLRRGSASDRRFVQQRAVELGLPLIAERRDVADLRRRDESPEEAARRVRREFLLEAQRQAGAEWIGTGHHLDDQAETILFRLVRGTGPRALTGIAPRGPGPFVRPLLEIERRDLQAYLERRGVTYRVDPSNRDLRFDRNRLRHRILPLLSDQINPRAAANLVRSTGRLRDDTLYLDGLAQRTLDAVCSRAGGVEWRLDATRLARRPNVLASRLVRLALERVGVDPRRITANHVQAVLALLDAAPGSEAHLPSRTRAVRRRQGIFLGPLVD